MPSTQVTRNDVSPPPWEPGADREARHVIERMLNAMKTGEDGSEFWIEAKGWEAKARKLDRSLPHTVKSYEHVALGGRLRKTDNTWVPNEEWHRYRILSSNKLGYAVRKTVDHRR